MQDMPYVSDRAAYTALTAMPDKELNGLIDLLTVECITAHLQRRTELVWILATELGVEVRRYWRPDERWLSSYQKIQLAHLIRRVAWSPVRQGDRDHEEVGHCHCAGQAVYRCSRRPLGGCDLPPR